MKIHRLLLPILLAISVSSCAVMQGQQSAGEYIDDAAITAEIKSKMAADRQVTAGAISVETLNGTTQLSGFATSQAEKDRAAEIARQAKGVKSVRNDIIVREGQAQR
jgi:hyperosmotically inducible periplasmic protein